MLLEKDTSVSIHARNIQCLATEMYKVSNGLSTTCSQQYFLNKNLSPNFTKTYLLLVFLRTGLKNGNLKIVPADFAKHLFLESALHRLSLR